MKLMLAASFVAVLCSSATAKSPAYFPPELAKPSYVCNYGDWKSNPLEIVSDFESGWYSRQLHAAAEPSLYEASKAPYSATRMTMRFNWIRSFHPAVFVRVEWTERGVRLSAKELSGAGGYDPGEIDRQLNRTLRNSEAGGLNELITSSGLLQTDPRDCSVGLDGAEWIIEWVDQRGYHLVKRWSPREGPVRELGDLLIRLTGWQIKPVY